MNKELGIGGLLAFSIALSVFQVLFLPVGLLIITLPIAFIVGVIGLMRSIKIKNRNQIIFSVIATALPWASYLFILKIIRT